MPGDPLLEPVRVAVRNGGRPVVGAARRSDARRGRAGPGSDPHERRPARCPSRRHPTASRGAVAARSRAADDTDPDRRRLDDHARPVDAPVIVTGRLSVAREVAWDPPQCGGSAHPDPPGRPRGPHRDPRAPPVWAATGSPSPRRARSWHVPRRGGLRRLRRRGRRGGRRAGGRLHGLRAGRTGPGGHPAPSTLQGTPATERVTARTGRTGASSPRSGGSPRSATSWCSTLDARLTGIDDAAP